MSLSIARQKRLARLLSYVVGFILVVLPFSALLTTWLSSLVGHRYLLVLWKEIVLVVTLPLVFYLALSRTKVRRAVFTNPIIGLMIAYLAIHLLRAAYAVIGHKVNGSALSYGLIINLRFMGVFAICYTLAIYDNWLRDWWYRLLIYPSFGVVVFGLMQKIVLPRDFLKHLGYGQGSLPVYQTVDQKIDYTRLQSTLRGANPLGAYLALIMPAYLFISDKLKRYALLMAGVVVLFFSYSRSAWFGLLASLLVLIWLGLKSAKVRQRFVVAVLAMALLVGGAVILVRNNSSFENTLFHTDRTSHSAKSSNASRLSAIKSGLSDLWHEPLGRGPGTAGPASVINQRPRIAENYYLQIGQEVGIIGLIIFLAINVLVACRLFAMRQSNLSKFLLATLVGISLINMVSHAWTDESLSLIWWSLAGVAIAPDVILNKERK